MDILIIDAQKGFIGENNDYVKRVNDYLLSNNFEHIIYTKFVALNKNNSCEGGLSDKEEIKLAVKKLPNSRVFVKRCHGLTELMLKYLRKNNITEVQLCGVDNQGSLKLFYYELQRNGFKAYPLDDLMIASKRNLPCEDIINNIRQNSVNSFYVSDLLLYEVATSTSIMSFAFMEWLLGDNHTTNKFLNIIRYYYKLYPARLSDCEPELLLWLKSGARAYRMGDGYDCLRFVSPIAHYAHSVQEISELVDKSLTTIYNTNKAKEASKIFCSAIWLLKNNVHKKELLDKLNTIFDLNISDDIAVNYERFDKDKTPLNAVNLVLSIFVNSTSMQDIVEDAKNKNSYDLTISATVITIAEVYYRDYLDISSDSFTNLPDKFKRLLRDFPKCYH